MSGSVIASARGWPGDWKGHVSVVRLTGGKIDSTTIALCEHSHRLSRTARECAMKLGRARSTQAAVSKELASR